MNTDFDTMTAQLARTFMATHKVLAEKKLVAHYQHFSSYNAVMVDGVPVISGRRDHQGAYKTFMAAKKALVNELRAQVRAASMLSRDQCAPEHL